MFSAKNKTIIPIYVLCKPQDNCKAKTYNRCTRENEKGIEAYRWRKSVHKDSKIGIKKQRNYKTTRNN